MILYPPLPTTTGCIPSASTAYKPTLWVQGSWESEYVSLATSLIGGGLHRTKKEVRMSVGNQATMPVTAMAEEGGEMSSGNRLRSN